MKDSIKNIVILGAGESGTGAAILAQKQGYDTFLSDLNTITDEYKIDLNKYNISFEEGLHTEERILAADLIIKSPGIPHKAPMVKKAIEKNIPIISEIEFGSWFTNATLIGITGTNGKTTTTLLTYHILRNGGLNVGMAGNIGKSFAKSVAEDSYDYYVLELSSFQLDDLIYYKNHIAVLTNITPDHLDRYDYKVENYIKSKFKITHAQGASDYFIFCADDETTMQYLAAHKPASRLLPFSVKNETFPGAYSIENNNIIIGLTNKNEIEINMKDSSLRGTHNRYNTMAAGVVARILDVRKEVIRESLKSFQNAEHRLEHIARINDVDYVNDSKATNVNSVWYALESFQNRQIIWIAGGVDKGNDYDQLKPLVRERVRALICLGKDNDKLHQEFGGDVKTIVDAHSMKEAITQAAEIAQAGDVVLLSPACASFDLFQNFEDRGRQFKQQVLSL
ncbi:MAG: UDP-N-acetylmuramoyl-L-alanine--D-glutamate ligase [Bacteroidetes bacterium]|nr:UDP-N-acetylmuramoyl-L-alanine--D-glutamate ligase [Bacteroidota bacterium]